MAGDSPFDQDQVLFGENFDHAQVFNLHPVISHAAAQSLAFEYAGRKRGGAHRTWSAQAVVLTVGSVHNPAKPVAANNALKAFPFGSSDSMHHVAFGENLVYLDGFAQRFIHGVEIAEFHDPALRLRTSFLKMAHLSLRRILLLGFSKAHLDGGIPIRIVRLYLRNYAGTRFDHSAGDVAASLIKDAGHADFFTDQSVHQLYIFELLFPAKSGQRFAKAASDGAG